MFNLRDSGAHSVRAVGEDGGVSPVGVTLWVALLHQRPSPPQAPEEVFHGDNALLHAVHRQQDLLLELKALTQLLLVTFAVKALSLALVDGENHPV